MPEAWESAPIVKDKPAWESAPIVEPYRANVQAHNYPQEDLIDKASSIAESIQESKPVEGAISVVDTARRGQATLLKTQPTAFWKGKDATPGLLDTGISANPVLAIPNALLNMGRNVLEGHLPIGGEGKPIIPDFKQAAVNAFVNPSAAPTPEDTKHQMGLPETATREGFMRRPEIGQDFPKTKEEAQARYNAGDTNALLQFKQYMKRGTAEIDPLEAARHAFDTGTTVIAGAASDPAMLGHPGATTAGVKAIKASTEALDAGKILAATHEAATSLQGLAKAGEVGLNFRAPFVGQIAPSLTLPKSMAILMKPFDAIAGTKAWKFVSTDPRSAKSILERGAENAGANYRQRLINEEVRPINDIAMKAGLDEKTIIAVSDVHEWTGRQGDSLVLRVPEEMEAGKFAKYKPDEFAAEQQAGMRAQQEVGSIAPALEHLNALPADQFAAAYAMLDGLNRVPERVRERYFIATGREIPELGGSFKGRPNAIKAEIEELKKTIADKKTTLTDQEAAQAKVAELEAELPEAYKKAAAVPNYRPGRVSAPARNEFADTNPLVERQGVGARPENSQRGYTHGNRRGDETLKDVPYSVKGAETEIARGGTSTPSLGGRPVDAPPTWTQQFLEKAVYKALPGLKEYYEAAAKSKPGVTFFQPNMLKAMAEDTGAAAGVRETVMGDKLLKAYDTVPFDALESVKRVAREGIVEVGNLETLPKVAKMDRRLPGVKPASAEALNEAFAKAGGSKAVQAVNDLIAHGIEDQFVHEGKYVRVRRPPTQEEMMAAFREAGGEEALRAVDELKGAAKPISEAEWTPKIEQILIRRPPTLGLLQHYFEMKGGKGSLPDYFSNAKDIRTGKVATTDAFKADATPLNRKTIDIDGKSYWMQERVVNDFNEWRSLGRDPFRLQSMMRGLAPLYLWGVQKWKQFATSWGPQYLAYNFRNQLGDGSRMHMANLVDGQTWQEFFRVSPDLYEFSRTGDPSILRGKMYDLGKYGTMNGEEVFKRVMGPQQVLGRGELMGDIGRIGSSATTTKGVLPTMGRATSKAGDVLSSFNHAQQAREMANRWVSVTTAMRQGDSILEAAMRTEQALFDYSRLSPAANILRQTGIVPFISWQSKNLPFVLDFALHNPGEFTALLRAFESLNTGEIPESQFPKYMRDKYNMVVNVEKNKKGELEATYITNSGVHPVTDLMELGRSMRKNGGLDYWQQQLGPAVQTSILALKQLFSDDTQTVGENAGALAKQAFGRPAQTVETLSNIGTVNPRTGETVGVGTLANMALNPFKSQKLNLNTSGAISTSMAKKELKHQEIMLGEAQKNMNEAIAGEKAERGKLNVMADVSPDEHWLKQYRDRVALAQQKVISATMRLRQVQADVNRVNQKYQSIRLAP